LCAKGINYTRDKKKEAEQANQKLGSCLRSSRGGQRRKERPGDCRRAGERPEQLKRKTVVGFQRKHKKRFTVMLFVAATASSR
jgi:hypothetical protein